MALHESGQMYLEAIYVLMQDNKSVRAIDVGAYLGYSKPSVSRALGILKKNGYISVDADGYITLSESGKKEAEQLYERHTVLTRMLVTLGVDEETAAEETADDEEKPAEKKSLKDGKFGFLFRDISFGKKKKADENEGEE